MGITVKQLIAVLLEHADPDAIVELEGCDCYGDCEGITVEYSGSCHPETASRVLIAREGAQFRPAPVRSIDTPNPVVSASEGPE
jgi:hypothetical protein